MSIAESELYADRPSDVRLFSVIPGGRTPSTIEVTTAAVVLGALLFLWGVRKGFRPVLAR